MGESAVTFTQHQHRLGQHPGPRTRTQDRSLEMTSSALAGLPPLPKSLSGMLNPGDSLSASPQGSAFRPIGGGGGGGRQPAGQSLYANTRPRSQERSVST